MFECSKFIWTDNEEKNSYAEFFDTFNVENGKTSVAISVDGDYTLYINGAFVSSSQYGDYEHYKIYDTIDISPYVQRGENSIAILVWHFGENSQRYKKYKAGLIFEVLENGKVILTSGEHTKSRKSPTYKSGESKKISSQLGFSYSYDATREDSFPRKIADDFSSSRIVYKNCEFFARPIKKHELEKPIFGSVVSQNEDFCHSVLDLGKEVVGFLTFDLQAEEETDIVISYGEYLENGYVKRKIHDRDFSITYRAKKGQNSFTNYMLRFACRYLEIYSRSPVKLEKIGIIPQTYRTEKVKVDIKNELDRQIYQICTNTLDACMMEHYVDCPWREQALYAFDSRNQMLSGYLVYKDKNKDYARANLLLISKDRRDDGLLSICYPSGVDLTIPSFSLHYIVALREYLESTGDKTLMLEVKDKVEEIIETFLKNEKDGLIYSFEGANHWNFVDWSENLEGSLYNSEAQTPDLSLSLLLISALISYQKICKMCGLDFKYEKKINSLKSSVRVAFFSPDDGLFSLKQNEKIYHILPNALAILLGVATKAESIKIAEKITGGELIEPSLSMKIFEYDALLMVDEKYLEYIKNQIREVYSRMLSEGSTTVWETKDGKRAFDGAGSLCHGWSAFVVKYLLM